ncbi:MAG: hypothetical protein K2Y25_07450 [Pseudomonadaceae bacterium]|nr:hypothetical protein [Pseudomonadaceae bacterium]
MSEDRELLEMAAKAAGFEDARVTMCIVSGSIKLRVVNAGSIRLWNPLTDDGDALRLAVKLSLLVECYTGVKIHPLYDASNITDVRSVEFDDIALSEAHGDDPYAATRRAIVRAAAAIGKAQA